MTAPTPDTEERPRTEAGRRLLCLLDEIGRSSRDTSFPMAYDDIIAIEDEALAVTPPQADRGLREAAQRAEFALSLATGATYDDRSWLDEAAAAGGDLRAALAPDASEGATE